MYFPPMLATAVTPEERLFDFDAEYYRDDTHWRAAPESIDGADAGRAPELAPAEPQCAAKSGNPIPHDVRYRNEIFAAARKHSIDPLLLAAVAAQETGGPGARSGRNVLGADGTGRGVFQIDSGSWQSWLAGHHDGMLVGENADKAAQILADNLRATGGNVRRALHRYNAGSDLRLTTMTTWGDGARLDYESSVLRHLQTLRG